MDSTQQKPKLVRDLMTVGVVTCSQDTSVKTIAQAIIEKEIEAVVVLDQEGHALGVVGQEELIQAYSLGGYQEKTAQEIMKDGLPTIPPDIPITAAAQLMQDQKVRVFYLTHHAGGIEYPAAAISYKHFLKHLASSKQEDIRDLGIRAERKSPLEIFIERRDTTKKHNTNTHIE